MKKSRTCIAVIKNRRGKLIMAGDRRVSCDWGLAFKCPNPKVSKKANGMLIGASGSSFLCKLLVDLCEPPEIDCNDLDTYMYYRFLPYLTKLLKQQPGYSDEHKLLSIPLDEACYAMVAVLGKLYSLDILNPCSLESTKTDGRIIIDDLPIPFALGCGGSSAFPILISEYKELGYNTKETLEKAMNIAAEIAPGCDNNIDYIQE